MRTILMASVAGAAIALTACGGEPVVAPPIDDATHERTVEPIEEEPAPLQEPAPLEETTPTIDNPVDWPEDPMTEQLRDDILPDTDPSTTFDEYNVPPPQTPPPTDIPEMPETPDDLPTPE